MVLAAECLHTLLDGDPHTKCAKCLEVAKQKICTPENCCFLCKDVSEELWSKIMAARSKTEFRIPKLKTSPIAVRCFITILQLQVTSHATNYWPTVVECKSVWWWRCSTFLQNLCLVQAQKLSSAVAADKTLTSRKSPRISVRYVSLHTCCVQILCVMWMF